MTIPHQNLTAALLAALLLLPASVMAAGEATLDAQAKGFQPRCGHGQADCKPSPGATDLARAYVRQARQNVCPDDSQDCALKGKLMRSQATEESRDRHSCRD